MQKYKKPKINEDLIGENPFKQGFQIVVHTVSRPNHFYFDGEHNLPSTFKMEREAKVSLYKAPEKRKLVCSLQKSTQALFLWVLYELEVNKDYLWVNKQRFMEESSFTYNTYKKAAKELVDSGILTKTIYKDTYWFNPDYCYNGNRAINYSKHTVEYLTQGEYDRLVEKGVKHG